MLTLLEELHRRILMNGVSGLWEARLGHLPVPVTQLQVRFEPQDEQWRMHVGNPQRKALNVYLVDPRENRKLHSNEQVRSIEDSGRIGERDEQR